MAIATYGLTNDAYGHKLGLFQSPGVLAWNHRLHAEGLSNGLRSSELEGAQVGKSHRSLVPTGVHDSRQGRSPHYGMFEYLNSYAAVYVDGTRVGMRFPGENRAHFGVPARRFERRERVRRGDAAEGGHAFLY